MLVILPIIVFILSTAGIAGRELPRMPAGFPLFLVIGLLGSVAGFSMALAAHEPTVVAIPCGALFLMVFALSYAVLGEQRRRRPGEGMRMAMVLPPSERPGQVRVVSVGMMDVPPPAPLPAEEPVRVSQIDANARPTVEVRPRR